MPRSNFTVILLANSNSDVIKATRCILLFVCLLLGNTGLHMHFVEHSSKGEHDV